MTFARYEYLLVLLVCGILPFLYNFHPKLGFGKNYKWVVVSILFSLIPFIIWDVYATSRGHWAFNPKFNLGVYIINLPLEEWLFFIVIPFCCLHVWNVMEKYDETVQFFAKLFFKK